MNVPRSHGLEGNGAWSPARGWPNACPSRGKPFPCQRTAFRSLRNLVAVRADVFRSLRNAFSWGRTRFWSGRPRLSNRAERIPRRRTTLLCERTDRFVRGPGGRVVGISCGVREPSVARVEPRGASRGPAVTVSGRRERVSGPRRIASGPRERVSRPRRIDGTPGDGTRRASARRPYNCVRAIAPETYVRVRSRNRGDQFPPRET